LQIGSAIAVVWSPVVGIAGAVLAPDGTGDGVYMTAQAGVYETLLRAWFLGRIDVEAVDCLEGGVLG
jgi:hypothetical protein